jgi:prepilin-type N-terminal cleavage/methylation domain-containing protein
MKPNMMKNINIRKRGDNESGFTLIELIATMVILSLMVAAAGYGIVGIAHGFVIARNNTEILMKAEVAILRLNKELQQVSNLTAGSATSVTFDAYDKTGTLGVGQTLTCANGSLNLRGNLLLDGLGAGCADFALSYYTTYNAAASAVLVANTKLIEYNFTLTTFDGRRVPFKSRITPRNL